MIHVDESDPVGEVALSFPHRDVKIRKGVDPKDLYDLECELGRGKFGTVFKCKEKTSGLYLAAKFVNIPKKEDRRTVEREVEIMKELQHPRLIQIYDAFENCKVMCVVLELIEGGELFERVIDDDFILTEKSCTVFMRQICEGISFIHKKQILHLDMKPENILCLTKTGNRIKIIDFGLARRFDPDKKLQVLFGTAEFVAPEVVNFDQIGFGTDMWSVGVICYVLLSGLSPFMGHTDVETMANVTIANYDFDDEAFDDISDLAKDFIEKLLIKDRSKRMSAEDCLKHPWLRRKAEPPPTPKVTLVPSMEVTKDNLKMFVERWNEHPNSPYVFEMVPNYNLRRNSSLRSLSGCSPSPCGSIASSDDSEIPFNDSFDNHLSEPHMDHIRRASDSNYVVKASDISERVNLAEEIRKLSDKLYKLSTMPTILGSTNNLPSTIIEKPIDVPELSHSISKPINISNDPGVPWRKSTKFRVTGLHRDVPVSSSPKLQSSSSFREHFNSKRMAFNKDSASSPNGTKNLLLKLLEQWDGPKCNRPRQNSVSSEWSDSETLGQRTISSLNTFFQSRATHKISQFHNSENIQSKK